MRKGLVYSAMLILVAFAQNCMFACTPNAGTIPSIPLSYCEGEAALNLSLPPNFGGPPPPVDHSYLYIISNASGVIIDISSSTDYTALTTGSYTICGLSILTADIPLLPLPNGVITVTEIELDITNTVYCADVTNSCSTLVIDNLPPLPIVDWPNSICAGIDYTFTVTNYDPSYTYVFEINSGSFGMFTTNGADEIYLNAISGPLGMCVKAIDGNCESETCTSMAVSGSNSNATILGSLTTCEGSTVNYIIDPPLPGGASYSPLITNGTLANVTPNSFDVQWGSGPSGQVCVDWIDGCGITQSVCANVLINQIPTAPTINGQLNPCIDATYGYNIIAQPGVTYNWTINGVGNINSGNGTNNVFVDFSGLGNADLCIELTNNCGIAGPVCVTLIGQDIPDPNVVAPPSVCDLSTLLEGTPGNLSNAVNWTLVSGPGTATFDNAFVASTNVTVSIPGLYTFEFFEFELSGCQGSTQVMVDFSTVVISNVQYNCVNGLYTVSFDISGGTAPYTVDGVPISGNTFTSGPITSGSPYSFAVDDATGTCNTIESGSHTCVCQTDAGTITANATVLCVPSNSTLILTPDGNQVFDPNDIGEFYLLDIANPQTGIIFQQNTTGIFPFNPTTMIFNQTYFVLYLVGNDIGGMVDLMDPCLDIANFFAVEWREEIDVTIGLNSIDCDGVGSLEIINSSGPINLSSTTIQWTQTGGPIGGVTIETPGNLMTDLTFGTPGSYSFKLIIDNNFCMTESNEVLVDFVAPLNATLLSEECALDNQTYTVIIDIEEGVSPYFVNGNPVSSPFVSGAINAGSPYSFEVEDDKGCTFLFEGTKDCSCASEPGTMALIENTICGIENLNIILTDAEVGNGDLGYFAIHEGPVFDPSQIIFTDANTSIAYNAALNFGATYYITYVVGLDIGGMIDHNDICSATSNTLPFVYVFQPSFDIMNDVTLCGLQGTLEVSNISNGSGSWSLISSPASSVVDINNSFAEVTDVSVNVPGVYTFEFEVQDNICTTNAEVSITFSTSLAVENVVERCDNGNSSYFVSFDVTGGGGTILVDGLPLTSNSFTSPPIANGTSYAFMVSSTEGCDSVVIQGMKNCNCDTDAGVLPTDLIEACGPFPRVQTQSKDSIIPDQYVGFYISHDGTSDSVGTIIDSSPNGTFSYDPAYTYGDTFYISFVVALSNTLPLDSLDPCLAISLGQPFIYYQRVLADAGDNIISCDSFTVMQAIPSATGVGTWTIKSGIGGTLVNPNDPNSDITSEDGGFYVLIWEVVNGTCSDDDSTWVSLKKEVDIDVGTPSCNGDMYEVEIVVNGSIGPYTVNGAFTDVNNTVTLNFNADVYSTISIQDIYGCDVFLDSIRHVCDCPSMIGQIEQPDQVLCEDEDLQFDVPTDITIGEDDTLLYFLHDPLFPGGSEIVWVGTNTSLTKPQDLELGRPYQLYAYIGAYKNGVLDFTDPCTRSGLILTVTWLEKIEVEISRDNAVCLGDDISISINYSGPLPFDIDIVDAQNNIYPVTITQEGMSLIDLNIPESTTLSILDFGRPCAIKSGNAQVLIDQPVDPVILTDSIELCNSVDGDFSIALADILLLTASDLVWTLEGVVFNQDSVSGIGQSTGTNILIATAESDLGICPNQADTTVVTIVECGCPDVMILPGDAFCQLDTSLVLNDFIITAESGQWILGTNAVGLELVNGNLQISSTFNGQISLEYVLDNPTPDCPAKFDLDFEIFPQPDLQFEVFDPLCFEDLVGEVVISNEELYDVEIYSDAGDLIGFDQLSPGDYELLVTDSNGCQAEDIFTISDPIATLLDLGDDQTINSGESLTLYAQFEPDSIQVDVYDWFANNQSLEGSFFDSLIIQIDEETVIQLIVTDENGCITSDDVIIRVIEEEFVDIVFPNIFNSSNSNFGLIMTDGVLRIDEFLIYDRWGNKMHQAVAHQPDDLAHQWNGSFNGQDVTLGVYIYIMNITMIDGTRKSFSGDVTLIR